MTAHRSRRPTVAGILAASARVFGTTTARILADRRDQLHTRARWIAMYVARKHLPTASYPVLGECFRRDHTTVMAAIRRVEEQLAHDPPLCADVAAVEGSMGL